MGQKWERLTKYLNTSIEIEESNIERIKRTRPAPDPYEVNPWDGGVERKTGLVKVYHKILERMAEYASEDAFQKRLWDCAAEYSNDDIYAMRYIIRCVNKGEHYKQDLISSVQVIASRFKYHKVTTGENLKL